MVPPIKTSSVNDMILMKRIPKASGKRCMESMGWLITVRETDSEISLLHPFSGVQIELPHQNAAADYETIHTSKPWTLVGKVVLSANPSHTSDYVLMVIEGHRRFLSFWRPGDLLRTRVREQASSTFFTDVVYFKGHFMRLVLMATSTLVMLHGPEPTKSHIVAQLPRPYAKQYYILESLGSLFVVVQSSVVLKFPKDDCDSEPEEVEEADERMYKYTYWTANFLVLQVDLTTGKVMQPEDLGDTAFFLHFNSSLSVQASQFPGIKAQPYLFYG